MSIRKHGIYTTALWDFKNMKGHFMYDKYACNTVELTEFESGAPVYPMYFLNSLSGLEYVFVPIIQIIDSNLWVKDINVVGKTNVRNQDAWQWKATLKSPDHDREIPMSVYYSAGREGVKSIPLRIELYDEENVDQIYIIYEFFRFRLSTTDSTVFDIPSLTPCKTTHKRVK